MAATTPKVVTTCVVVLRIVTSSTDREFTEYAIPADASTLYDYELPRGSQVLLYEDIPPTIGPTFFLRPEDDR